MEITAPAPASAPPATEAIARPLSKAAKHLHAQVVRMRTRPSLADYCFFTARTNLAVLLNLIADLDASAPDVVDIGCGPKPFRSLFPAESSYIGVDFAANAAADLVHDLGEPLPLADASADVVLLSEVMEHLRDPELVLAEAARILRPGGRLFVSTPFAFPIHSRPYDYFRYTEHYFRAVGDKHPLELVRLEDSNSVLTTPIVLMELLLLHVPKVPFVLKRCGWAVANLVAAAVDGLIAPWRQRDNRVGGFLRSNPVGYAAGYRRR